MRLEQVGPYLWRIPPDAKLGMRVPGLIVADEALISHIRREASLEQLANGATLPGIVKAALAMPDIHQGYGLPVGGVVATDAERGVVSPGAIGFDINCGVRLLATGLDAVEVKPHLDDLVNALFTSIPTGVGSESRVALAPRDLNRVLERGAAWAVERGWGDAEDVGRLESEGRIAGADPSAVSAQALDRGRRQLGTLGAGNHFLEIQVVDEIFDERRASDLGVRSGQVTLMIHTGSRGPRRHGPVLIPARRHRRRHARDVRQHLSRRWPRAQPDGRGEGRARPADRRRAGRPRNHRAGHRPRRARGGDAGGLQGRAGRRRRRAQLRYLDESREIAAHRRDQGGT